MLVAQNSLGPVCPVPLTVRGMGTVEWNHFDLDPDNSPVIKVCGEDN